MGALVFGRYRLNAEQGVESFVPGTAIDLDGYDGFDDQSLEGLSEGQQARFILDPYGLEAECGGLPLDRSVAESHALALAAPFVVTTVCTPGSGSVRVRVERRTSLGEELRALPAAADSWREVVERVAREWKLEAEASSPQVNIARCALPTVLQLERLRSHVMVGEARYWRERGVAAGSLLFLSQMQTVAGRVLWIGSNLPDSCLAFDVDSSDSYRDALHHRAREARSEVERASWGLLLDEPELPSLRWRYKPKRNS